DARMQAAVRNPPRLRRHAAQRTQCPSREQIPAKPRQRQHQRQSEQHHLQRRTRRLRDWTQRRRNHNPIRSPTRRHGPLHQPPPATVRPTTPRGPPPGLSALLASPRPPPITAISSRRSFIAFTVSFADACTSPFVSANSSRKIPAAVSASDTSVSPIRVSSDFEIPP